MSFHSLRPTVARITLSALVAAALLTACTPGSGSGPGSSSAAVAASGRGSAVAPTGLGGGDGETSSPPTSAAPSSPARVSPTSPVRVSTASTPTRPARPVREIAGTCPYISGAEVAQIEGDRFGHSTILTSNPVGCRFYFQYDETAIITEITVRTFATATDAFNAMVLSAKGHPEVVSETTIGDGAVAIRAPLQGVLTWQCTFAKGVHLVTVHTRQPDPSFNARALARQVATRF